MARKTHHFGPETQILATASKNTSLLKRGGRKWLLREERLSFGKMPTAEEQLTLERNMQLPVWTIARLVGAQCCAGSAHLSFDAEGDIFLATFLRAGLHHFLLLAPFIPKIFVTGRCGERSPCLHSPLLPQQERCGGPHAGLQQARRNFCTI